MNLERVAKTRKKMGEDVTFFHVEEWGMSFDLTSPKRMYIQSNDEAQDGTTHFQKYTPEVRDWMIRLLRGLPYTVRAFESE